MKSVFHISLTLTALLTASLMTFFALALIQLAEAVTQTPPSSATAVEAKAFSVSQKTKTILQPRVL
ncbi:hypothetical protein [Alteromonas lipolytica]|nr:hypothetical protein [Alteromonas lipolytica]